MHGLRNDFLIFSERTVTQNLIKAISSRSKEWVVI